MKRSNYGVAGFKVFGLILFTLTSPSYSADYNSAVISGIQQTHRQDLKTLSPQIAHHARAEKSSPNNSANRSKIEAEHVLSASQIAPARRTVASVKADHSNAKTAHDLRTHELAKAKARNNAPAPTPKK